MNASDIVGYTYRADNYCPRCVMDVVTPENDEDGPYAGWRFGDGAKPQSVESDLDEIALAFGIDRMDECTYDSGEFPKVVFGYMVDSAYPEQCGNCGEEF